MKRLTHHFIASVAQLWWQQANTTNQPEPNAAAASKTNNKNHV
jgi:hypothetical protein